jgi:2-polyprenyl-6-hydroxyphenyl methylase/3-demethylubiquinone-9 3-methyltransferase
MITHKESETTQRPERLGIQAEERKHHLYNNNVSAYAVRHFDQLAADWWDLNGPLKTLHAINPIRIDYIMRCCGAIYNKNILDVGCGGGILAASMAIEGAQVTGLDMSVQSLQIARTYLDHHDLFVQLIENTAEEHMLTHNSCYDVVVCMELVEHVPDPELLIKACCAMVAPGGWLFISTLNRTLKSWFYAILTAEYVMGLLPIGTHQIAKFIRPDELCTWIDNSHLIPDRITGLTYNPLNNISKLCKDTGVNYLLAARRY